MAELKEKNSALTARWENETRALGELKAAKEALDAKQIEFDAAARSGDLERAARIRYGEIAELHKQQQALESCDEIVKKEGIHSIMLCPGFTHQNVAEISEAVGKNVGVSVARGDGPSSKIAKEVMKREGWFS